MLVYVRDKAKSKWNVTGNIEWWKGGWWILTGLWRASNELRIANKYKNKVKNNEMFAEKTKSYHVVAKF